MTEGKPVITISIPSDGKSENINKCLSSLSRLQDALPTEILITDLGMEETFKEQLMEKEVRILRYMGKNKESEGEIRNFVLEKALGRWVLFLSDSEWLENTDALIEFLSSKDHEKMAVMLFPIRRDKEKELTDAEMRLFKTNKKDRFVGDICPYWTGNMTNRDMLTSVIRKEVDESLTPEDIKNNGAKKTAALRNQLKKERKNKSWWLALLEQLSDMMENGQLYREAEDALKEFKNQNDPESVKLRCNCYLGMMLANTRRWRFGDTITEYERSLEDRNLTDVQRLALTSLAAEAYFQDKDYEKVLALGKEYLQQIDAVYAQKEELWKECGPFQREYYTQSRKQVMLSFILSADLRLGNLTMTRTYFADLQLDNEKIHFYWKMIGDLVEKMIAEPYDAFFAVVAKRLTSIKRTSDLLLNLLSRVENGKWIDKKKDEETPLTDEEKKLRFARAVYIFSRTDSKNFYFRYLKLIQDDQDGVLDDMKSEISDIFHQVSNVLEFNDRLFDIARKRDIDLMELIDEVAFDQWRGGVDSFCANESLAKIKRRCLQLTADQHKENPRLQYLSVASALAGIRKWKEDNPDNVYELMHQRIMDFVVGCRAFMEEYYTEEALHPEYDVLPSYGRAAYFLGMMLDAEEKDDIKEATEQLKKAMESEKLLVDALKVYGTEMANRKKDHLKEEERKEKETLSEMMELSKLLKEKVRNMIQNGMYADALHVIMQLKTLTPSDEELSELEAKINGMIS